MCKVGKHEITNQLTENVFGEHRCHIIEVETDYQMGFHTGGSPLAQYCTAVFSNGLVDGIQKVSLL